MPKLTILACMAAAIAVALSAPVGAQKKWAGSPRRSSPVCTGLQRDIDNLSKSMAMNFADGIGDDSARRATMRETEYQSLLSRVRLTMDLMRDNRCKMPTSVPTGKEYASAAIACRTEILRTGRSSSEGPCDQSKWTPKAGK